MYIYSVINYLLYTHINLFNLYINKQLITALTIGVEYVTQIVRANFFLQSIFFFFVTADKCITKEFLLLQ